MAKRSKIGFLMVFFLFFVLEVMGQYTDPDNDEYEVPFVPTHNEIVDEMLKIAKVSENDVVYDLGCGDGRIVITAVKKYGCRGVGIDIDPIRIGESKINALKEGVRNKVQFIQQDLFQAYISDATAVMMYLIPQVNLRLRPKLFKELKSGTRIVSHNYDMGDWKPDSVQQIFGMNDLFDEESHTIYYWVLPANVSGIWEWTVPVNGKKEIYNLHLTQKFQEVSGNLIVGSVKVTVTQLNLDGNRLKFTSEEINGHPAYRFEGTVKENVIEGTMESKIGLTVEKKNWKAKRDDSTKKPDITL